MMKSLSIRLVGEIHSSNFDEWKKELIDSIQAAKTELVTDDDFAVAETQVKSFKAAESTLKAAKHSGLDSVIDVQLLFAAIDEVSEETRQVRLMLERQIRVRKAEIKHEYVESGLEAVHGIIDAQSDAFKKIDHSVFLDRSRFDSAIKGKSGLKGVQRAIGDLVEHIRDEIEFKSVEVTNGAVRLDSLPEEVQLLFQDRPSLLALAPPVLELTIEKRIAVFEERSTKARTEKALDELAALRGHSIDIDTGAVSSPLDGREEAYQITLEVHSNKESAIELARSIRQEFGGDPSVTGIRLTRKTD